MWIRPVNRFDYPAVDKLLLQLQQADAASRPDMFAEVEKLARRFGA